MNAIISILCLLFSFSMVSGFFYIVFKNNKETKAVLRVLCIFSLYMICFAILIAPYYIEMITENVDINNELLKSLYKERLDLLIVGAIIFVNYISKIAYKFLMKIRITDKLCKFHKNILFGMQYTLIAISIVTSDTGLFVSLLLYFVGSHFDYKLKKANDFTFVDFRQRFLTFIFTGASILLLALFYDFLVIYDIFFLIPWYAAISASMVFLAIVGVISLFKKLNKKFICNK